MASLTVWLFSIPTQTSLEKLNMSDKKEPPTPMPAAPAIFATEGLLFCGGSMLAFASYSLGRIKLTIQDITNAKATIYAINRRRLTSTFQ